MEQRIENLKIALDIARKENENKRNLIKSQDRIVIVILSLAVLLMIPLVISCGYQVEDIIPVFVMNITFRAISVVGVVCTIVFSFLALIGYKQFELTNDVFLNCGDEEQKYIMSLLYNLIENNKKMDKIYKMKRAWVLACIISLTVIVFGLLSFCIICLI